MKSWSDRYWTSRDGLTLHYRDYDGPPDRAPLLCLHGLTRNARDFESLAERFAGEWGVIAPDFRGRAGSEHDPE
ncbi:MAG: alpha/beta hydrolase, partial [Pseudomonadota bacterium]|nr:alpha/beta hydrolase [Pseudomonadota bacterium]